MLKFNGSIDNLMDIVNITGIPGRWKKEVSNKSTKYTFRSIHGGVILNWWPTGTINLQGKEYGREVIERALKRHLCEGKSRHNTRRKRKRTR